VGSADAEGKGQVEIVAWRFSGGLVRPPVQLGRKCCAGRGVASGMLFSEDQRPSVPTTSPFRRNDMAQVYGYKEQDNDFRFFPSKADWEKQITVDGIKRYLNDHLRIQVCELRVAIDAFKKAERDPEVGQGLSAATC
jgi:hypothetical protein